jgi:hypothetical protein
MIPSTVLEENPMPPGIRRLLAESAYLVQQSRKLHYRACAASLRLNLAVEQSQRLCDCRGHLTSPEVIIWREGAWRCELWSVAGHGMLRLFCGPALRHEETPARDTGYERAQQLRQLIIASFDPGDPF